jgi:prepilin-type N-terminal cleavage/methylation domain-containing protein
MNPRNRRTPPGFTLLELVVVLAILAIVTAVATRTLSQVEDQRRFESSQRGLEDLEAAILGSDEDRAPDGSRISGGFVADMGRLPRTVANGGQLTLAELWLDPGTPFHFDARPAVAANGVDAADEDPQVLVPGGWRGPYVRLPLGANNLKDGWGNDYSSPIETPTDPDIALTTGYARLRDANDAPITEPAQDIAIVRHLGANGRFDPADESYDRDEAIAFPATPFSADRIHASLKGTVEVMDEEGSAMTDMSNTEDKVTVRVFAPNPADPTKIIVYKVEVPFQSNPVIYEIPETAGVTIGPRIVRASFTDGGQETTSFKKSAVKTVILRSGVNIQDLKIDR